MRKYTFTLLILSLISLSLFGCGDNKTKNKVLGNNTVNATNPTGQKPNAPATLVSVSGDAKNTLTFASSAYAISYNLYWSNSSGVSKNSTKISGIVSPYIHTGLTNGTTYYYAVTAVNIEGESVISVETSACPSINAGGTTGSSAIKSAMANTIKSGANSSLGASSVPGQIDVKLGKSISLKQTMDIFPFTDTNGDGYYELDNGFTSTTMGLKFLDASDNEITTLLGLNSLAKLKVKINTSYSFGSFAGLFTVDQTDPAGHVMAP
jgi:uncharacterized protein YcfL